METMKKTGVFVRFGFRVLLFNAIVLLGIFSTTWIIREKNYKDAVDRGSFQSSFFNYCAGILSSTPAAEWDPSIMHLPGILFRQRILVFTIDKELVFDSGTMKGFDGGVPFSLLFPHPYIDIHGGNYDPDPDILITALQKETVEESSRETRRHFLRTIPYDQGLDRVYVNCGLVCPSDGGSFILVLCQSLVDILMHNRAVKERFILSYAFVSLLSLLLTILLVRSVIVPLKSLHTYSLSILAPPETIPDLPLLAGKGEIGHICLALEKLLNTLGTRADNFRRFSSDIVHELRTPLAAVRSGLELFAESSDLKEKADLYERINRRITRMENLMDDIRLIGDMEVSGESGMCEFPASVLKELLTEFATDGIVANIDPAADQCILLLPQSWFGRIVDNLVRNAVSFSPAHGSVAVSLLSEGPWIMLTVSDLGPGIRKEVFPHLCNRFFSYRPGNGENHSGLGLSIVDAILRNCGGKLEYRNRPEGGAQFSCRIPYRDTQ